MHRYLVALGSNMRVPGIGPPPKVVRAAEQAFEDYGIEPVAISPVISSAPLGPSLRRYSNAAAVVESALAPPAMLAALQQMEAAFGRRRRGGPWRARPLDLDIVLWSGGVWAAPDLVIPHPMFRTREFVLKPAARIAPHWRDPVNGLTLRQLAARAA